MNREFHRLRVAETREEIQGAAKSVMFEVPEELREAFRWRPGQHLTLRFELGGEEVRRTYTISSSPFSGDPLRITVKRVPGGLVSNHINDRVNKDNEIDVMPPSGDFCLDPGEKERRTHYFFGAGSGITPLFSMIHSILLAEPHSVAHLIYGNRNDKSILFQETLAELQGEHRKKLTVSHVLSAPSLLSWFTPWRQGKIDQDAIRSFIDENPPYAQDAHYYICGPGGMNSSVKQSLQNIDVPEDRIHLESFGGAKEPVHSVNSVAAQATVVLLGQTHSVAVSPNQTLLDGVCKVGLNPPYSCQAGICGACKAQLIEGSVHMHSRSALDDDEVERGAVLTCQAVATSESLKIKYS